MASTQHYVPILKAKLGELGALGTLTADAKQRITPLLEVPSFLGGKDPKASARKVAAHFEKAWGDGYQLYVDTAWSGEEDASSAPTLSVILEEGRSRLLRLVPVTGLTRTDAYQAVVRTAGASDEGICVRLEAGDLEHAAQAKELASSLGFDLSHVDLLLDFKSISNDQVAALALAGRAIIAAVPELGRWRRLILAASAFPLDMSQFQSNRISRAPRAEWALFNAIARGDNRPARIPFFGDYAIQHPRPKEIDPKIMNMTANLRYTSNGEWMILKARNVKQYGYAQFNTICRTLIDRDEYAGGDFSWGDQYIERCARGQDGPGSATTWRKVGTSHHLTLVARQIASLGGP